MAIFAGLEHIVRENEPIANFTWLRLGGAARYFAEPTSVDELKALVTRCRDANLPVRVLGGGSNVLVRDEGVAALVIHLAAPAFGGIAVQGCTVTAGGGAKLSHVISTAVREGLAGLEPLVGIPGTVGGALRTNAGANGSDIGQCTKRATVMTRGGDIVVNEGSDLRFAYRQSSLDELVILSADFGLEREDVFTLTKRMQKLWIVQKSLQPQGNLNVGCIFQDVGGISAASLIEQAGFKSAQVGQVSVSDLNANFIVAQPQATSSDVIELIDKLRNGVAERLGVALETELQVW
jgi:UDP-N-acetylmuramate dehydrogenase